MLGVYKKVRARMCRPRSVSHIRRTVIFTTSWTSRRTATTSSLQLISRTKAQRCNSRSQACYGGRTFRPLRLVRRTSAYSASRIISLTDVKGSDSRSDSTTLRYMKQSVTLVAMQSLVFEQGTKELERLRNFFARTVGVNVAIFQAAKTVHGSTMDISTRMFTASKDAPEEEHISLSADIDPDGVLKLLLESEPGFVHCMDNHVDYLRVSGDSSTGKPT